MVSDRALKMGPVEWILLLVLSVLWGGSFFFVKLAVAELPPFTIVLGRVGLAALALNLLVRAWGQRMPSDRASWAAFFAMGALNNLVPFSLIVWAQTQIASGLASILNGATPLFTVLLAHWLTADERLTWNRLLGVALGLAGVTVMIGMEALSGLGLHVLAELADSPGDRFLCLRRDLRPTLQGAAAAGHRHRPGDRHDRDDAADRADR